MGKQISFKVKRKHLRRASDRFSKYLLRLIRDLFRRDVEGRKRELVVKRMKPRGVHKTLPHMCALVRCRVGPTWSETPLDHAVHFQWRGPIGRQHPFPSSPPSKAAVARWEVHFGLSSS